MPKIAFTDLSVRALKPGTYFDTKTPAFGMRVGKHRRTWIVVKGAKSDKQTVGHYPQVPLSEARKKALTALGSPYAPKVASVSYADAVEQFLEDNYRGKGPRTKSEAKRLLDRLTLSGSVIDIGDQTISKQLGKLAHVPSEQLHAFRVLRTFFRWCTRPPHRHIPHSPLEGYCAPGQDKKRKRILTDDELVKIWNACEGKFGGLIQLIMLWGTRSGETARIRRTWIERNVLTIDGSCTKNKRSHAIPLLPMAQSVLKEQKSNRDYFFPGRWDEDTHFNDGSWGKEKKKLDKRAGVFKWQVRDLRRTFRSNMARLGVSRTLCEILINHVTGTRNDLDEIYDRYDYLSEKRDALAKYEAHMQALLKRS